MNTETKDEELENEMIPQEGEKVKSNQQNIYFRVSTRFYKISISPFRVFFRETFRGIFIKLARLFYS